MMPTRQPVTKAMPAMGYLWNLEQSAAVGQLYHPKMSLRACTAVVKYLYHHSFLAAMESLAPAPLIAVSSRMALRAWISLIVTMPYAAEESV